MSQSGSATYLAFIEAQLSAEDARKASIEQRGIAVITTSGALASLLLGFAAVATGAKDFTLSSAETALLVAAVLAFALAALAALATNVPVAYHAVLPEGLRALVQQRWTDTAADAEQRTAATVVDMLERARLVNTAKGWILFTAMAMEAIATIVVAAAAVVILA